MKFNVTLIFKILITAVLAFISGQMWNSIRGPQYLMRARGGGIGFVYPSSQQQLIAETHIILILYAACTSGVIFLAKGISLVSLRKTQIRSN